TLSNSTTNSWLFPPQTREVQFDEKWSFVTKKEKRCDRADPDDDRCGDCWDHVAIDAESRLVLSVVPGRRSEEHTLLLVQDVAARTGGAPLELFTSDENPASAWALLEVYGEWMQPQRQGTRGRHPNPVLVPPQDLTYFTLYSYNFCWPARTLRQKVGRQRYRQRTPAMAAGLADHIWPLREWLTYPGFDRCKRADNSVDRRQD